MQSTPTHGYPTTGLIKLHPRLYAALRTFHRLNHIISHTHHVPATPHALPETLGEVEVPGPLQIAVGQDRVGPDRASCDLVRVQDLGPVHAADAAVALPGRGAVVDDAACRVLVLARIEAVHREEAPGVSLDLFDLVMVEHGEVFGTHPVLHIVGPFVLEEALAVVSRGLMDAGAGLAEDEGAFVELGCQIASEVGLVCAVVAYEVWLDAPLQVSGQGGGIRTQFEFMTRGASVRTVRVDHYWGRKFGNAGTDDWVADEVARMTFYGHICGIKKAVGRGGVWIECWEGMSESAAGVADSEVAADRGVRPK